MASISKNGSKNGYADKLDDIFNKHINAYQNQAY